MSITSATATKITWLAIGFAILFGVTSFTFWVFMTHLREKTPPEVFALGFFVGGIHLLLSLTCICLATYADSRKDTAEAVNG